MWVWSRSRHDGSQKRSQFKTLQENFTFPPLCLHLDCSVHHQVILHRLVGRPSSEYISVNTLQPQCIQIRKLANQVQFFSQLHYLVPNHIPQSNPAHSVFISTKHVKLNQSKHILRPCLFLGGFSRDPCVCSLPTSQQCPAPLQYPNLFLHRFIFLYLSSSQFLSQEVEIFPL